MDAPTSMSDWCGRDTHRDWKNSKELCDDVR